jgi:hypothetical protein
METGKKAVFGGAAAKHSLFSGIFPFSLEGEGVRG